MQAMCSVIMRVNKLRGWAGLGILLCEGFNDHYIVKQWMMSVCLHYFRQRPVRGMPDQGPSIRWTACLMMR